MKIIDFSRISNKVDKYNESWQMIPCKFSFCEYDDKAVYPLFKPVLCREYLTDVLGYTWKVLPTSRIFHGFSYTKPINLEEIALLIQHTSNHFLANLEKYLFPLEKKLGLKETKVVDCDQRQFFLLGDKFWQSHTVIQSWYTGLLRLCNWTMMEENSIDSDPRLALWRPFREFLAIPLAFVDSTWEEKYLRKDEVDWHHYNGFYCAWKQSYFFNKELQPFVELIKKYANTTV